MSKAVNLDNQWDNKGLHNKGNRGSKDVPNSSTKEPSAGKIKLTDNKNKNKDSKNVNKKKRIHKPSKSSKLSDTDSIQVIEENNEDNKSKQRSPTKWRKVSTPAKMKDKKEETDKENVPDDLSKLKLRKGSKRLGS